MFTYKSYTMAVIIWLLMGLTGGFAFWPAIMKGIRMTGTDEEQGRMYGIFEALNGLASLLLSFIMIGVMAVVGGSDSSPASRARWHSWAACPSCPASWLRS